MASYLFTALKIVRSHVKDNPNALGFAVVVSHQDVHPDLAYISTQSKEANARQNRLCSLTGIDAGAKSLENSLTMCGLTVLRRDNPTKSFLFAIIKALNLPGEDPMSIKFPKSYRYSFFYTTGHGANKVFFTKDGSVSYQDVYNLYNEFGGFLSQRYFFFDNCRSSRLDERSLYPNENHVIPPCPELIISPGNRMICASASGCMAWGPKGEGVSFMTKKMAVLLKKKIPLNDVLSRLLEEIWNEVVDETGKRQQIVGIVAAPTPVDFWKEQKEASEFCRHCLCSSIYMLLQ